MTDSNFMDRPRSGSTASSLMRGIQVNDASAWRRLITQYRRLVGSWCKASGLQQADTSDVCQDVFTALARHAASFRWERTRYSFRGWLRVTTSNFLRHRFRGKCRLATTNLEIEISQAEDGSRGQGMVDAGDGGLVPAGCHEIRAAMDQVRAEISPLHWNAFWQTVIVARKPNDVAADLQITANVVYLVKSRVLRRLRELLASPPGGASEQTAL